MRKAKHNGDGISLVIGGQCLLKQMFILKIIFYVTLTLCMVESSMDALVEKKEKLYASSNDATSHGKFRYG